MTSLNLIEQILEEQKRVRRILPFLDSLLRFEANRALVFADQNMARNDTLEMKHSLEQLKLFRKA